MSIDFTKIDIGGDFVNSSDEDENNESGTDSLEMGVFEEKKLEFTNNKQTISVGSRMKAALPIQLKKLDRDLDWSSDHKLPRGLVLNEHTGSIKGRVADDAKLGAFNTNIYAESNKVKWVASFSITITCSPIERVIYPHGNILTLIRGDRINDGIYPVVIGSVPEMFQIKPCAPWPFGGNTSDNKELKEESKEANPDQEPMEDLNGNTGMNPLTPLGLTLNAKTGAISGCPPDLGKTSWIVTASNASGSKESDILVLHVRRGPDELGPPKQSFGIPQENFKPMDLESAIRVLGVNQSGRFVRAEVGNILRACGLTPTPKEVQRIFAKYAKDKPFVKKEHLQKMVEYKHFYKIDLTEIVNIFEEMDEFGKGTVPLGKLRKMLKEGVGVDDAVINDICKTLRVQGSGDNEQLNWKDLLDLYCRITHGVGFEQMKH